jgi:type I restriction enzyme M protein
MRGWASPTPALLAKAVEKLDAVQMDDRDTKGDVYDYMLGKIATAGQNGQFRTPRHIIALMVELTSRSPQTLSVIPLLAPVGSSSLLGSTYGAGIRRCCVIRSCGSIFHETMFNGFDFDGTMLRIGAMNMILHGVENAHVVYRDSLAEDHSSDAGRRSL